MREQCVHASPKSFGVPMVLKSVMHMHPWAQFSPRWTSTFPATAAFQAAWQAFRAAFALLRFVEASSVSNGWMALTFCTPDRFWPAFRL